MAGGLGFEPRLTESESVVLPLDDPPNIPVAQLNYCCVGFVVRTKLTWMCQFSQLPKTSPQGEQQDSVYRFIVALVLVLTLRVLRSFTGLVSTNLFTFYDTRIARYKSCGTQDASKA